MINFNEFSTDELEFMLPIRFQRKELHDRHCGAACPKGKCCYTVTYEQRIWRSDCYTDNKHRRTYEISYYEEGSLIAGGVKPPFQTGRHTLLYGALVEMCEILFEAEIIQADEIATDREQLAFFQEHNY